MDYINIRTLNVGGKYSKLILRILSKGNHEVFMSEFECKNNRELTEYIQNKFYVI